MNSSYGYDLYKKYRILFGAVKIRTVYYNLRKGVLLNEFMISDIKREVGEYTWGTETERVYYTNGPYSNPVLLDEVQITKLKKFEPHNPTMVSQEQIERVIEEATQAVQGYSREFRELKVGVRVRKYKQIDVQLEKLRKWIGKNDDDAKETILTLKDTLARYEY